MPTPQYDNETVRMMQEMGIWHPGLVLNRTGVGGHINPEWEAEQAAMQHILALREHSKDADEVVQARKEARDQYAQQRSDTVKLMEQGRNDRASEMRALREQAEKDRVNQGLIAAAHETFDPAQNKAIMAEYYRRLGVTIPGVNDNKPVAGEYGPGGARVATNVSTAPNPYTMPERMPIRLTDYRPQNEPGPILDSGPTTRQVYRPTAPQGYDYNLNTGEYVRKDQPGFINGQQVGGTVAPLARNVALPQSTDPNLPDVYERTGIPRPPLAVGNPNQGSPFDQFIMSLMPNAANKQKLFGPRTNPNYVPPPDGYPDYVAQ